MLTFVPQVVRSFHQVREAQAIRGHQLRGVRDLTALLVPLLTDALEKAVQLAEAMEARGYGQWRRTGSGWQIAMAGGLSGMIMGWLAEAYWRNGSGWLVIIAGVLALVIGVRGISANAPQTTRYRRQAWSVRDALLAASSFVSLGAIVIVELLDPQVLAFYPYPRVTLPPFDVRLGLSLALLGAPALLGVERRSEARLFPQRSKVG